MKSDPRLVSINLAVKRNFCQARPAPQFSPLLVVLFITGYLAEPYFASEVNAWSIS